MSEDSNDDDTVTVTDRPSASGQESKSRQDSRRSPSPVPIVKKTSSKGNVAKKVRIKEDMDAYDEVE